MGGQDGAATAPVSRGGTRFAALTAWSTRPDQTRSNERASRGRSWVAPGVYRSGNRRSSEIALRSTRSRPGHAGSELAKLAVRRWGHLGPPELTTTGRRVVTRRPVVVQTFLTVRSQYRESDV